MALDLVHEQTPGHDQRLLVRQQNPLAGPDRRQCRHQTHRADNCGNDNIDLCGRGHPAQTVFAGQNLGPLVERGSELTCAVSIAHDHEAGFVTKAEFAHARQIVVCRQGEQFISIGVLRDDIQCGLTARSGRAEQGDPFHADPASHKPATKTGAAATMLSIRSSTPP